MLYVAVPFFLYTKFTFKLIVEGNSVTSSTEHKGVKDLLDLLNVDSKTASNDQLVGLTCSGIGNVGW